MKKKKKIRFQKITTTFYDRRKSTREEETYQSFVLDVIGLIEPFSNYLKNNSYREPTLINKERNRMNEMRKKH